MRLICFIVLAIVTLIEIGPVPITGIMLMWVILFRPRWFYNLVIKIYATKK